MFKQSDSVAAMRAQAAAVKPRVKLHDKQSERDHRELRIDKVGVRGLRFPIQIRDKAHSLQNTVVRTAIRLKTPAGKPKPPRGGSPPGA